MGILRDYGYVDARGMGIRTKVLPLMRNQNKTDPQFEATEDFIKTTLFIKPADTRKNDNSPHKPSDEIYGKIFARTACRNCSPRSSVMWS
jgi:predicted HTH transcriptional regulator